MHLHLADAGRAEVSGPCIAFLADRFLGARFLAVLFLATLFLALFFLAGVFFAVFENFLAVDMLLLF